MRSPRVISIVVLAVLAGACSSSSPSAGRADPCTWLKIADVRRIIGRNVETGSSDPTTALCSYAYTSTTGVRTDLVVGPWPQAVQSIGRFTLPNHTREVIADLGGHAVFLKARTIDDGNSVMIVVSHDRSLLLGGEFLNRGQAKELATLVLANWS